MRGHEPLVAMRKAGRTVPRVNLLDVPLHRDLWAWWEYTTDYADVRIEPDDNPKRLDMRFVVGLDVWVHGRDRDRLAALYRAAKECAAKRVVAFLEDRRGQIVRIGDSMGVLTWRNG